MRLLMVDIIEGVIPPGERLPRETDLAAQFDVSRGVIRETLRGLEERGLVVVRHGHGAVVTSAREWNVLDADVLTVLVQSAARSEVLGEFLEARRIIEIEACARAAERATEADLAELARALAHSERSVKRAAVNRAAEAIYYESDIELHQAVLAASGNRVLSRLTAPIQRALLETRKPLVQPNARLEERLDGHRRIVKAIANRDPAAARAAMSDHLDLVQEMVAHDIDDSQLGGVLDDLNG